MPVSVFDQLKNNLVAVVDYPNDVTELIGNAKPWRDFCNLPQEVKDKFIFEDDKFDADAGYRRRARERGREDKEFYHYSGPELSISRMYDHGLKELVDGTPEILDFLHYCEDVHRHATNFVTTIVKETDKDLPGFSDLYLKDGTAKTTLRLLHYIPESEKDEIIADAHYDRGGFTLHLFESDEGLEYMDWDNEWKHVPLEVGKTIMFTGFTLSKYTDNELQKTWHRVRRIKDENTDTAGRISLVLFCELQGIESYSEDLRSQDETPSYEK